MRQRLYTVAMTTVLALLPIGACGSIWPQQNVRYANHAGKRVGGETDPSKSLLSFSTPASLRLGFLKGRKVDTVYCAEPMPDVAMGADASVTGSLASSFANSQAAQATAALATLNEENEELREELEDAIEASKSGTKYERTRNSSGSLESTLNATANLQAAAQLAIKVSELGGRSQQVLLAREFLYRLCEARANDFIGDEKTDYLRLQERALTMIETISSPPKASESAERTALIKQVVESNKQMISHCEAVRSACEGANKGKGVADQKDCASEHHKCITEVKLLVVPETPKKVEGK